MKNVIEFKDVGLNFGGVKALDGISFEVKEGSLFSIIGPNGAGKTSVFNCINGIYRPTSGEIKIFDKLTNGKSVGFRAPSFSLNKKSSWIIDVLEKNQYV